MMLAMRGMFGGIVGAGALSVGAIKSAKDITKGAGAIHIGIKKKMR